MSSFHTTAPTTERRRGRGYLVAGLGACLLGLGLAWAQFALEYLFVPWYAPALATAGALLVLVALVRRPTVVRALALLLVAGLAGLEWFVLGSAMKLPEYAGPSRAGQPVPPFTSALADGRPFTDASLRDGPRHALVFFRGRW